MEESQTSCSALSPPWSWGQGSVKSRDRTWLKSTAVFPADLLTVMATSHPRNYIKPQHNFFFFSWTLFIAELCCTRYFGKVRMAYGEQNWSFLQLGKCVSVHGWLAPRTAPQVWTWHACWEAKWQRVKVQWKQIVIEHLKTMNKIRICCGWFIGRSNKYKVMQIETALLQAEGFVQSKLESSLSSKARYPEGTEKLLSRVMMNEMSPHTYLISNWNKLTSWMKLFCILL